MWISPEGIIIEGKLLKGLEIFLENGKISEIRSCTKKPEQFVLSPAFINAHSHLEYRGMQGIIEKSDFWTWVYKLNEIKHQEILEHVQKSALTAAKENKKTGVAFIAEHASRPVAGNAMNQEKIQGIIFQEIITLFEYNEPFSKVRIVEDQLKETAANFSGSFYTNPHSVYMTHPNILEKYGKLSQPLSIHLAETPEESEFFLKGSGPLKKLYDRFNIEFTPTGCTIFEQAVNLGIIRKGTQIVHGCDLSQKEVEQIAKLGASIAHCPRSNEYLNCPIAPIREMLDENILVGLGLDSPASSGPIDMFAEMRKAIDLSKQRNMPLKAEEVWKMTNEMGAASLSLGEWSIKKGITIPLIKIHLTGINSTQEIIEQATPEHVEWI